jgi:FixJ family two-component response regulator
MAPTKPICILDDDVDYLRAMERLLAVHGLRVKAFSSAEEFQAQADPRNASHVILDIHLGAVSGIDVLLELVRSGVTTPVVVVTASDSEAMRRAAIQGGCDAYLQKPVSAKVLLNVLRDAA